MPEQEFESFLSVLGKHLRLSAAQKASIAAELRDHLETRFAELVNSGMSHDEAVRRTLDDVGDGKQLAGELASVRRIVQTRRLTRLVAAGVTVAACVLVMSRIMVWRLDSSDSRVASYGRAGVTVVPRALGQAIFVDGTDSGTPFVQGGGGMGLLPGGEAAPPGDGAGVVPAAPRPLRPVPKTPGAAKREALERRLDELAGAVSFQEVPLREAVLSIVQQEPPISVSFATNLDLDVPVTLDLPAGVVSLRTLFALLVEQCSSGVRLAAIPRDGMLYLTVEQDAVTIEVYPVDDLTSRTEVHVASGEPAAAPPAVGMMMGPGMAPGVTPVQMGGMGGGMPGKLPGMASPKTVASSRGRLLVDAVREAVVDEEKLSSGQPLASISEVNGLLVVRATASVHRDVVDLLGKMRQALADQEQEKAPAVPGGGAPHSSEPAPGTSVPADPVIRH